MSNKWQPFCWLVILPFDFSKISSQLLQNHAKHPCTRLSLPLFLCVLPSCDLQNAIPRRTFAKTRYAASQFLSNTQENCHTLRTRPAKTLLPT